ncbi:MAG: ketoacyl-ACP synthase III, partial [Veillonella sp.]|nr:ketoacyl-ACP synthase III [Veillonella sp.]
MAFLHFNGIGISALSAAVPKQIINNYEYTEFFPEDDVKKVVDKVGIYERRFADENTCSSDLCYAAAEKLIADNGIDKNEIDLLVFISQTPDYRMPATSIILQNRLGLPTSTIAFDINLGCSAFIYGMGV